MTGRREAKGGTDPRAARDARLKAALRANLARRKAAARAAPEREGDGGADADGQAEES